MASLNSGLNSLFGNWAWKNNYIYRKYGEVFYTRIGLIKVSLDIQNFKIYILELFEFDSEIFSNST